MIYRGKGGPRQGPRRDDQRQAAVAAPGGDPATAGAPRPTQLPPFGRLPHVFTSALATRSRPASARPSHRRLGLALPSTSPAAVSTGLVINEVYAGGGSAGATYTNKFVELYNPTAAPSTSPGWSCSTAAPTGTAAAPAYRAHRHRRRRAGTTWSRRPPATAAHGAADPGRPPDDREPRRRRARSAGTGTAAVTRRRRTAPAAPGSSTWSAAPATRFETARPAATVTNATSREPQPAPTPTTTRPTSPIAAPRPRRTPAAAPADRPPIRPDGATIAEIQGTGATTPARRPDRHHRGRRHRGLPDRRLQRLLPPDRRHRRRRPPRPRRLRRRLRLRPALATGARSPSATTSRSPARSRVHRPHRDHAATP